MEVSKVKCIVPPEHLLHGGMFNKTLRLWQTSGTELHPHNLMYPVFIVDKNDGVEPISSLPGISRFGVDKVCEALAPAVADGLSSVLLFGVPTHLTKDARGSAADAPNNPVILSIKKIKEAFPDLTIACDVCLCAYTDHGHCGILTNDGKIDNEASVKRITEQALAYAMAGADIVAPSDMMDGRVGAIKSALQRAGMGNRVSLLAYAAKFASSFYGPFREAAQSAPSFGDRKCYQLPPASKGMALRAVERDVAEGADMLMVKPGLAYLDIVCKAKEKFPDYPMFIYQVSGEYAMLCHAANAKAIDLQVTLMEILSSMRRAGADVIITYFAPKILRWIKS